MFGLHVWDLLMVLLIALLIFGPHKLPEIGGAFGKSIREFQKASRDEEQPTALEPMSQPQPPASSAPDGETEGQEEVAPKQVV